MLRTILVVDDNDRIRQLIGQVLFYHGYTVVTVGDGDSALKAVSLCKRQLILLDMRMPGMDGPTFLAQYCQQPLPHIPIIVLTAQDELGEPLPCSTEFLPKPFSLDALVSSVQRHLSYTHLS
jgi:CheY-like chemotaxis protein